MRAEALLGPLPQVWQDPRTFIEGGSGYVPIFTNRETGQHVFEDPRLEQLPPNWRLENPSEQTDWNNWYINDKTGEELKWPMNPGMTPEQLECRGVPLQDFVPE